MNALYNMLVGFFHFVGSIPLYLVTYMVDFFTYLYDLARYGVFLIITSFTDGVLAFVANIPRPEFFTTIDSSFCDALGDVGYFASQIAIVPPLAIIISAYTLRFIIRRIPLIG